MIEITGETNTMEITLGQYLFKFDNFDEWCDKAKGMFKRAGILGCNYHLCIDTKGRICPTGKEFMRARDENAFPIKVFIARITVITPTSAGVAVERKEK